MKKYKIEVKLTIKMDLPSGICLEELTGNLKQHIDKGKYLINNYKVTEIK
jgi:hypothetical protein